MYNALSVIAKDPKLRKAIADAGDFMALLQVERARLAFCEMSGDEQEATHIESSIAAIEHMRWNYLAAMGKGGEPWHETDNLEHHLNAEHNLRLNDLMGLPADDQQALHRSLHKPGHQHEKWQIRESPDGGRYCAACGAKVTP